MKRTFEEISDDEWEQNTFKPSKILNATNPPPPPIESFAYDPSKSAPNGVVDLTADDTEDEYAGVASGPARGRRSVIDDEEEEVDWRSGRGRRKGPVKRAELASKEKLEDITRTTELQEQDVGACSGRSIPFRGRKFVIDDDDDEDTGVVSGRTGGPGLAQVVAVTSEGEWEDEVMGATSMDEEEVEEEDLVGRALQRCGRISEELRRELYGSSVPATASGGGYSEVDASSARIVTQDEVSAACGGDDSDFEPLLKPYQLVGVNFLLLLRRKKIGGAILADEMGLGKTVQAITYLSLLNYLENDRGPHLVVCPASVLENWERELTRWCPSYSVLQYHGAARVTYSKELSSLAKSGKPPPFDVMLVCYSLFERRSAQQKDDRKILKRWPWSCVLMDEAHALKDKSSYRWKNLMSVARNAKQRLMLTGTPLQNDLHELWSMLEFLMPDLFATEDVDLKKLLNAEDRDLVTRMKSILGPFILRRQKSDVMQQLVPKVQRVEFVQMVKGQTDAYQEATEEYRSGPCFSRTSDADSKPISKLLSRRQISSYFTQLRKIANHPLLVRRINSDEDVVRFAQKLYPKGVFGFECTVDRVIEEMKGYSDFSILQLLFNYGIEHADGSLLNSQVTESAKCQALARLLPSLKQDGHRVLIFSQWTSMLDILEWTLDVLGITYRRLDGSTPVSERQTIVDTFNNDTSIDACLLSTRAGGQGLNLTGADTVIIHDMDFNPQIDRQAEDRCHRIGQTRPVTIYRLVTKSTVDEKIYEIAKRKLYLDAAVLEGGAEMDDEGEVTEKTMGEILSSILLV